MTRNTFVLKIQREICHQKSFGSFEKRAPEARFSKFPGTFRARKADRKTTTCLFCKAGLIIRCKGNRNKNNCQVSCLETPSFWRYKENYVTRNSPETFRDFRETGPWTRFQNCGEGCVCESYTERLFPRELGVFLSHPKKTLFDSNYLICSIQSANTSTVNSMHRWVLMKTRDLT